MRLRSKANPMTIFMLLFTESQAAFRVLWLRKWFRVCFWMTTVTSVGLMMKEI
jgi:hypothetical protein